MQHLIYRCQHCNKEYTYCTYGNGPYYGTEKGCTIEYCAECAQAIAKALSIIPIKFEKRQKLITDIDEFNKINSIFNKCKTEYEKNKNFSLTGIKVINYLGYKKVEGCYINKVEYHRCTKENGVVDIFVFMEYDLINNQFTGKKYFENDNPCEKYFPLTTLRFDTVLQVKKFEEPIGKIFFNDFEWTVETKYKDKQ